MYLEILAADDTNSEVETPRWMGVDLRTKNQITRWALKSENLAIDTTILKAHDPKMGDIASGCRNTDKGSLLKWSMVLPLPTPEVEIIPFMVDWSQTQTHPHDELPNMGCKLIELYGTHPNPDQFTKLMNKLELDFTIKKSEEISLKAILKCPKGTVEI